MLTRVGVCLLGLWFAIGPGSILAAPAPPPPPGPVSRPPGEAPRNGALLATLTVGGQEVLAAGNRPITIDTRGPVITSRQPKPRANLTKGRPNILVNFFDA